MLQLTWVGVLPPAPMRGWAGLAARVALGARVARRGLLVPVALGVLPGRRVPREVLARRGPRERAGLLAQAARAVLPARRAVQVPRGPRVVRVPRAARERVMQASVLSLWGVSCAGAVWGAHPLAMVSERFARTGRRPVASKENHGAD